MNRHILILYGLVGVLWVYYLQSTVQPSDVMAVGHSTRAAFVRVETDRIEDPGRRVPGLPAAVVQDGTLPRQKCPAGQFMTGIGADGKIECASLTAEDVKRTTVECNGHGFVQDGFCRCDEEWIGDECQNRRPPRDPNALPDEDHDNWTSPPDCDDSDDLVYPGAPDSVDGKDNDCDGTIDEGY